jgi:hypothetical protein
MRFFYYTNEATYVSDIAGDDDYPPGNIISGMKYKRSYRDAIGNLKIPIWTPITDWKWDEFENTKGQDKEGAYHDSLKALEKLYGDRLYKYVKPIKIKIMVGKDAKSKERLKGPGDEDGMENVKKIKQTETKKTNEENKILEKINFFLKNNERKVKKCLYR